VLRDGKELDARELPIQEAAALGKDVRGSELEVLLSFTDDSSRARSSPNGFASSPKSVVGAWVRSIAPTI
jgi:hypothetical protein